jgi:hypothetical protein
MTTTTILTDWSPNNAKYETITVPWDTKDRRKLLKKLRTLSSSRFENLRIRMEEMKIQILPPVPVSQMEECLIDTMLSRINLFNSYPVMKELRYMAIPKITSNDSFLTEQKFVLLAKMMTNAHSQMAMIEQCLDEVEHRANKSKELPN